MGADPLEAGRQAFATGAWRDAYGLLARATDDERSSAEDLERLAVAAHLVGEDDPCVQAWERAYRARLAVDDAAGAARAAFWLSFELIDRGEVARGSGWASRGTRLVEDAAVDCVERGYLALPEALALAQGGDPAGGLAVFERIEAIGVRFADADLLALARNGRGRSLVRLGERERGLAVLDEVMVAVAGDEVSPVVTGTVYCSVIEACHEVLDLRRADEWTAALSDWCDAQPGLVPYRGKCLVYRCEILQRRGDWPAAAAEARRACDWLARRPEPVLGLAFYRSGELCRVRGELDDAAEQYRRASRWGHDPQPGLALLRLEQGDAAAARASLERALTEPADPAVRAELLAALVDVLREPGAGGEGDTSRAERAAHELATLAAGTGSPALAALASYSSGVVHLARGQPSAALDALRRAWATWEELAMPYDAARARAAIGRVCRELGDVEGAELELGAAVAVFEELGARPELDRLAGGRRAAGMPDTGPLTPREVEIIRLVASGRTNREIAEALVISEKTVGTHVGNIFTKLGLSNRVAATAYAYEHGLV